MFPKLAGSDSCDGGTIGWNGGSIVSAAWIIIATSTILDELCEIKEIMKKSSDQSIFAWGVPYVFLLLRTSYSFSSCLVTSQQELFSCVFAVPVGWWSIARVKSEVICHGERHCANIT